MPNTAELLSFIETSRTVWNRLSPEKKESYYCDNGTIGFVYNMAQVLKFDIGSMPPSEFDIMLAQITADVPGSTKNVRTIYSPPDDLTFIMEETFDSNNNLIALECRGFYFGKPDADSTKVFYGDLRADFNCMILGN